MRKLAGVAALLAAVVIAKTARPLVPEAERFTGADLPAKHLVLTFDQGPSTTTADLAGFLETNKIAATFFVDARYREPGGKELLLEIASRGHAFGNRASTNRDLVTQVPLGEVQAEVLETDEMLEGLVPWNRKFFRAPFGSWTNFAADAGDPDAVYNALKSTPLDTYVGPIYWNIEADCAGLTNAQCTDAYLLRIRARSSGIVRFDDTEQTFEVVKALVPALVLDGYTFDALDTVPALAAALPKCDATCLGCTGPAADDCSVCAEGSRLFLGKCLKCAECPSGSYAAKLCAVEADTLCAPCAAGTYQPAPGSASCMSCGDCSDGDACTTDACDPVTGCTHTKIPDCPKRIDAGSSDRPDAGARSPGQKIDDENHFAVSAEEDESGCSTGTGSRSSLGLTAIAVAFCIARLRRRRR